MTDEGLKEDVRRLHALYGQHDYGGALKLASTLRSPDDPTRTAWVSYYEVLCLYRQASFAFAYELLKSTQDTWPILPPELLSYLLFVGCELAFRLNEPIEVVEWGRRSADIRHKAGRLDLAVESSRSVCEYMAALETNRAPALPFARYVLTNAPSTEAGSVALSTMLMLARDSRSAPLLREALDRVLLDGRTRLDPRGLQIVAEVERTAGFAQVLSENANLALTRGERLFQLCAAGQVAEVRRMLDLKETNVNFQWGKERSHAVQHAAFQGKVDVLQVLFEFGAEVDSPNAGGNTALMLASRQGHAKAVAALLEAGAAPERANVLGQTALHLAVAGNHVAVADLLLAAGADPGVDDAAGLSPWSLAKGSEMKRALGVLRKRPGQAAPAQPEGLQLLHRVESELLGTVPAGVVYPQGSTRHPPGPERESGLCERCGAVGPTRPFHYRTHVGVVLFYLHQEWKGELCRRCAVREGIQAELICLLLGWWNPLSLIYNLRYVFLNPYEMTKLARLPGRQGAPLSLDQPSLRALDPHLPAIEQALKTGVSMRRIAAEGARRAGVAPDQVVLYARMLGATGGRGTGEGSRE